MSSSSLYGVESNVTVSTKNLTTLYNATTGNTVVANVPDRNFTTLYAAAGQTDINPTRAYGNANVEAFLNVGSDGANNVQNITMNGVLTVGGDSYLGDVGSVHIDGGSPGYVLTTNGYGELIWSVNGEGSNAIPYIHFDVTSSGNNQQFSNVNISFYEDENYFSLFKNGINLEPGQYEKVANSVVQVNVPLQSGDDIDILPSSGGSGGGGGTPGGTIGMVQFNSGFGFGGDSGFLYDTNSELATISNISITQMATFSEVGNVNIPGGLSGQVLGTDGSGTLSWISVGGSGPATEVEANIANVHIYDGSAGQLLMTDGAGNLSWASITGSPGGSNTELQFNNAGAFGGISTVTWNGSNLSLGSNTSVKISGGTSGAFLQTDGTGNLAWANISVGGSNTQVQYNDNGNLAASSTFTFDATSNTVTTSGTLQSNGNLIVKRAFEPFTSNSTAATGTINIDVLDQSIYYFTTNASSNCSVNFRGNSSTTLDSILPSNDSLTVVVLNTVGSTAYVVSSITIDGVSPTIKYVNGNFPGSTTLLTNAKQSYTYTILKTAANTYTVLASFTEYQ